MILIISTEVRAHIKLKFSCMEAQRKRDGVIMLEQGLLQKHEGTVVLRK